MSKIKLSISISKEYVDWIDEKVKKRVFANRSHGVEYLIVQAMEKEKK